MLRIQCLVLLVVLAAGVVSAGPLPVAEYGTVSPRQPVQRQDVCHLSYYNICSGWVLPWGGYCYGPFGQEAPLPPKYGTCFDLAGCPGQCRNLEDVWWACARYHYWGSVDVEVYCADENACPQGAPLAGIYGYHAYYPSDWQHFRFHGLPLCGCDGAAADRFIIMITQDCTGPWGCHVLPYSDAPWLNVQGGCEPEWRCSGHSYVYQSWVSYCNANGAPGPLWLPDPSYGCTDPPVLPPACIPDPYEAGVFCEWLIDCYVSCQGPTATEKTSWSGVKAMYR
jgi:hypothetical protein